MRIPALFELNVADHRLGSSSLKSSWQNTRSHQHPHYDSKVANPPPWHRFRHTVSAWGKEAGLELEDVKTLLRHENIATTPEIYGHLGLKRSDGFSKG
jgi:integrase